MWCLAQKWLSSGVSAFATSITSYQTLPRHMPSHHAPIVPRYPDGYRTLPRNSLMRPESICSVSGSVYDRVLRPSSTSTFTTAEKRRSLRDDTMWQLYEWQQRQAFSRQSLAPPAGLLPPLPGQLSGSHMILYGTRGFDCLSLLRWGSLWHTAQHQDHGQHLGAGGGSLHPHVPVSRRSGSLQHLLPTSAAGGAQPQQPPL